MDAVRTSFNVNRVKPREPAEKGRDVSRKTLEKGGEGCKEEAAPTMKEWGDINFASGRSHKAVKGGAGSFTYWTLKKGKQYPWSERVHLITGRPGEMSHTGVPLKKGRGDGLMDAECS